MNNFFNNELWLFAIYIASGIIICVLFDIFRALRKSIKTPDVITYIEDSIFWIITSIFLIYLIFILNSGNIRIYTFIGLALGGLVYYFSISKYFMKITVNIFTFLKKVFAEVFSIILIPIKTIFRINKKLICFVCINLQNTTNIFNKFSKITKTEKKRAK